jgi:hypothetical protein
MEPLGGFRSLRPISAEMFTVPRTLGNDRDEDFRPKGDPAG